MFDVGFSELLLLAIIALVVLGPEKLPHAARIAGAWVGRIRRTISSMQTEIEREVAAQEVRTQLAKQFSATGAADLVRELQEERRDIEATLESARQSLTAADTAKDETPPPLPLGTPPAPALPEVARPLDEVEIDGEKAYRQWLDAQRRPGVTADDSTPQGPTAS